MKKKREFSKLVIAMIVPAITGAVMYITYETLQLAKLAIQYQFSGALPYLVAVITPAWAALTAVVGFYFNKSKAENLEKIKNASQHRDA